MDETYGTYVDDECFDIHGYDGILTMILMMILTVILMMILMLILMMMLMMVGAGTCILSRLKVQGPCPGTNEHPRIAMGMILSQIEALRRDLQF